MGASVTSTAVCRTEAYKATLYDKNLVSEAGEGRHGGFDEPIDIAFDDRSAGNTSVDKLKPLGTANGILFLNADPGKK